MSYPVTTHIGSGWGSPNGPSWKTDFGCWKWKLYQVRGLSVYRENAFVATSISVVSKIMHRLEWGEDL